MASKSLVIASTNKVAKPVAVTTQGDQFFIRLAKELQSNLAPKSLANVYAKLRDWDDSLTEFRDNVRDRLLALTMDHGEKKTDKGTLEYETDGFVFQARPTRTGYDPKRVESLLRAKSADVGKYMMTEVTYKLDDMKLGAAIEAGVLTQDELETCRYELKYSLQPPKHV